MRPCVVPEGFCSAVPCEPSEPRTIAECFPELAKLLNLCLLSRLTVRVEKLFCSFSYRFVQSSDKRRDDVSPAGGICRRAVLRVTHA